MKEKEPEKKLTHEEFILRSIKVLRKPPYLGIHSVYSGFCASFRKYYNTNPVLAVNELAKKGRIVIRPCKGGVMMYDRKAIDEIATPTLEKILGKD